MSSSRPQHIPWDNIPAEAFDDDRLKKCERKVQALLQAMKKQQGIPTHIHPSPPPIDPLVYASDAEMNQPADPEWRRFKNLVFRVCEIASINNVDANGHENGDTFTIMYRNGHQLVCGNERNFANSGTSTFEWFLIYVMQLPSKRAEKVANTPEVRP